MSNGNNHLTTLRDCLGQSECEWLEFKHNASRDEESIGQYISALANGAATKNKPHGYLIWGVDGASGNIVGTSFRPLDKKIGSDCLKFWLGRRLHPHIPFDFHNLSVDGKDVVLLEVPAAVSQPVRFKSTAYIRIGASQQKLSDYPQIERRLWLGSSNGNFEQEPALENVSAERVMEMLDHASFFSAIEQPSPDSPQSAAEVMARHGLLGTGSSGTWSITKMGALLYARRLADFDVLPVKKLRVITYKGDDRLNTIKNWELDAGYASSFEQIIDRIIRNLPEHESYVRGLRKTRLHLPEIAIRELVANAIVHRDYRATGYGIMVEIFPSQMEISNIGESLVPPDRILDHAPKTRNEKLVDFMRQINICEELGSGIDKVVGS
ncbi:MAG: putative DNA binding domain-containing protein, partial [Betaproteobacteria bacterium]|nr:putative DNA binding domain-containing protein [Betaproteobacteria bacterium]